MVKLPFTMPDEFDDRCRLMLDVTCHTLQSDPDLKLCEGLRLIESTRTAVARIAPSSLDLFETRILPEMREILLERFGICDDHDLPTN